MATSTNKDAHEFVEGVVSYLRKDKRSQASVPKVRAFLGRVTAEAKKQKVAHIESTVPLTDMEKNAIKRTLAHHIDHEVTLECVVNNTLLGGLKIQIGDWIIDTSLKSQLDQMATILIQ